jgi:hypothetical protein
MTATQNHVTYRLTEADVIAATELQYQRTTMGRFALALMGLFFLWFAWNVVTLARLPRGSNRTEAIVQCAFVLVLIAIFWADQKYGVPRRARNAYRRVATLSETANLTWDPSGLQLKTESSRMKLDWDKIWRRQEDENLILLYQAKFTFIIIPKRAFLAAQLSALQAQLSPIPKKS